MSDPQATSQNPSGPSGATEIAALRRDKQAARAALTPDELERAGRDIADRLWGIAELRTASVVAVYHAIGGELPLAPTIERLRSAGKLTVFPLLRLSVAEIRAGAAGPPMTFHRVDDDSAMVRGPLGIPAPAEEAPQLAPDVVLAPLVVFDELCNRIGMGGGYYDRTFAGPSRPLLIGVAHDCQGVEQIDAQPWDVPLDVVVTPTRVLRRTAAPTPT